MESIRTISKIRKVVRTNSDCKWCILPFRFDMTWVGCACFFFRVTCPKWRHLSFIRVGVTKVPTPCPRFRHSHREAMFSTRRVSERTGGHRDTVLNAMDSTDDDTRYGDQTNLRPRVIESVCDRSLRCLAACPMSSRGLRRRGACRVGEETAQPASARS